MSFYRGPNIVTSGLIMNLDAGNVKSYTNGGTSWRDLSGNARSASFVNNPIFNSENNGSIVFNGTNNYVQYGTGSGVTTDWTVNVWFYPTSVVNYKNVLDCNAGSYSSTTGNLGPRIEMNSSGSLDCYWSGDTITNNNFYRIVFVTGSVDPLQANTWYNACVTRNSSNVANTYMNGILKYNTVITSGTPTATYINTMNNINIGRGFVAFSQTDRNMQGRVALVQIYNRVLNSLEVLQNYNALKSRFNLT